MMTFLFIGAVLLAFCIGTVVPESVKEGSLWPAARNMLIGLALSFIILNDKLEQPKVKRPAPSVDTTRTQDSSSFFEFIKESAEIGATMGN
jgi:hypothetical protein